ncbi:MAG: TIGR01777 family protein [Cytophagales bacterium]|nr:MAG: TIGR01777 family protein [Cytophagales bacterium]
MENHEVLLNKGHLITPYDIESILESKISYIPILKENAYIKLYEWDIAKSYIEEEAIKNADYIIHLAGAGVADESWTATRKKEILESRTLSTKLLAEKINTSQHQIKAFVSASAIGYYGLDTGNEWQYEAMESNGKDFLTSVVKAWENEIFKVGKTRTVAIRIGVVLSESGGALEKMAQPIRLYVGAALGSGHQYISWIHIDDLCEIFIKAIEDSNMSGIYNAAAPQPITNEGLTKAIGKALDKPILPINVPAFALKLMLGEMAAIVLGGNRVSAEKIEKTGFKFQFREIKEALKDLL